MSNIKWDYENFGLTMGGGNNSILSPYAFDNVSIWADVEYQGKTFTAEFQNGHGFIGNDFNCPSEDLTFWSDNAPEWVSELWYDENDDFLKFVNFLKESAEKYLSTKLDSDRDINSEIAELYWESPVELTFLEFSHCYNHDKESILAALKEARDNED